MVLDAGGGFDAGGDVDQVGLHGADGIAHVLRREAAGKTDAEARRASLQNLPRPHHPVTGPRIEERQAASGKVGDPLPVDLGADRNSTDDPLAERVKVSIGLFTVELNRRQATQGLTSYAIHPGIVNTDLFYRGRSQALKTLARPFVWLGYKTGRILTPEQGAATSIYLAANDVQPSGAYWADETVRPMNPVAQDEALGRDLWAWSESLLPV